MENSTQRHTKVNCLVENVPQCALDNLQGKLTNAFLTTELLLAWYISFIVPIKYRYI